MRTVLVWALAGAVSLLGCSNTAGPPPATPLPRTIFPPPVSSSASANAVALLPPPLATCAAEKLPAITAADLKATDTFAKAALPAHAAAPVARYCDGVRALGTRQMKRFPDTMGHLGQCFATAKGAWSLEVSNVHGESGTNGRSSADWTLAYVDAKGTVHRRASVAPGLLKPPADARTPPTKGAPPPEPRVGGSVVSWTASHEGMSPTYSGEGVSVAAVYDFDGDGVDEIVLALRSWNPSTDLTSYAAFMFRDGEIWNWVGIDFSRVRGVADVDHDGRPDILLDSSFRTQAPCGVALDGPIEVAHARATADGPFVVPDDAFSVDDDVARAAVRAGCPGAPTDPLVTLHRGNDTSWVMGPPSAMNIACARFWGESASGVVARVESQYPKDPAASASRGAPACAPRDTLVSVAKIAPPLSLLPRAVGGAPCAPPTAPPLGGASKN